MRTLREWTVRFWGTLRPGRPDSDIEEELRAHVALAAERGQADTDAARRVTQAMDALRDQRGLPWLDHLIQDTRYGLRGLRRNPLFASVAILSLALGIGANTALFSLVDDLLLRSLPVRAPERLVQVRFTLGGSKFAKSGTMFPPEVYDEARAQGVFSEIVGYAPLDRPLVAVDGVRESTAQVEIVSENYFRDLGVPLAVGRAPQAGDGPSAIVSDGFWRRRFGANAAVLGRSLTVDGQTYTIVGVASRRFTGLALDAPAEAWVSAPRPAPLTLIARLKPDVGAPQAQAAMLAIFRQTMMPKDWPADQTRSEIIPAAKGVSALRGQYERPLQALTILVTLVLLLTCSNVGGLLMVRNAGRRREVTVRVALGAGRGRLLAQYLVESLLLAALSGALAIAFARWGVAFVLSMLPLAAAPASLSFDVDARVLAFVAGISVLSALLFGLAPAWKVARVEVATVLRASQGATAGKGARRFGRWLVACQVGLSILLLVGGGLFVQTLRNLRHVNMGFDADRLLQVQIDTRSAGYRGPQVSAVYRLLAERLSSIAGVRSVTFIRNPIMRHSGSKMATTIPGVHFSGDDMWDSAEVGPDFFETMRIPLLRGRTFTSADFDAEGARYVVNEAWVRHYLPNLDPLKTGPIVGVVGDVRLAGVRAESAPMMYERARREMDRISSIEVRTAEDSPAIAAAIRDAVRAVNPRLLIDVKTLRQEIDRDLATERMVAAMSAFFSVLGLLLAAIGIFGVASYSVAQRTNELGIRMALGAGRWTVIVESLRDTMQVFAAGLLAGVIAAFAAVRLAASAMEGLLFGLTPTDTVTIAAAGLAMVAVAIAACVLPARHATRIDPLAAIRHE